MNNLLLSHLAGSGIGGAFALLRDAEKRLKQIVTKKFDKAVVSANDPGVERYQTMQYCKQTDYFKSRHFFMNVHKLYII